MSRPLLKGGRWCSSCRVGSLAGGCVSRGERSLTEGRWIVLEAWFGVVVLAAVSQERVVVADRVAASDARSRATRSGPRPLSHRRWEQAGNGGGEQRNRDGDQSAWRADHHAASDGTEAVRGGADTRTGLRSMISNRSESPTRSNSRSICAGARTSTSRLRLRRARASASLIRCRPALSMNVSRRRSTMINSALDSASRRACCSRGAEARSNSPQARIQVAARPLDRTSHSKCWAPGLWCVGDWGGGLRSGKAELPGSRFLTPRKSERAAGHPRDRPQGMPSDENPSN